MGLAKKRVRLHTKDGRSLEGVLVHRRPQYVLEVVDLIEAPGPEDQGVPERKVQLDGQVRLERENVSFYQVIS